MIKKLVERPIAVTMTIIAILIVGTVAIGKLPVSLMPDVDIPQITVQISLAGSSAREVDEQVIKPLRLQLVQIPALSDITCEAENGGGRINMKFNYDSDIDLNFIEVNEKVDKVFSSLPIGMERPKVIKASVTDIPAFFINVTSKGSSRELFIDLGRFAQQVLSKRVEQIPQVAFVDMSGVLGTRIVIEPYPQILEPLGISALEMENAIKDNDVVLGNLSIKDGHYRWNISFDSNITEKDDIEQINLNIGGRVYPFSYLAKISEEPYDGNGLVMQGEKRAVTMAVIKQADARMPLLKEELETLICNFEEEYPHIEFKVTRNQTELLDYSIDNLKSNIIIGAILAVLVIFVFMNDYKSPLLVMITIPLSLVVSLLTLYLLGISINIISLSGLILGLGMMVDNSIIVIDNITQLWQRGYSLKDAVSIGAREVIAPMLSSVLTTCSVFVPLIFLSGISGALFYDQAMAVTVALFTSLFVAVFVIPVYYNLIYRKDKVYKRSGFLKGSAMGRVLRWYEMGLKYALRNRKLAWIVFLFICAASVLLYGMCEKSKLPPVTHSDVIVDIDWNESVDLAGNKARCEHLMDGTQNMVKHFDMLVGKQDFLLSHSGDITQTQARIYVEAYSPEQLEEVENFVYGKVKEKYPKAKISFSESANIFNVIFDDNQPVMVAMLGRKDSRQLMPDQLNDLILRLAEELPEALFDPVLWQEQIVLMINPQMMALYDVTFMQVYKVLKRATRENTIMSIKSGSTEVPVVMGSGEQLDDILSLTVRNAKGVDIPLRYIVKERIVRDLKSIVSGRNGDYYPLNIDIDDDMVSHVEATVRDVVAQESEYTVDFAGSHYSNRKMIGELAIVLAVSLLLLYFILAAQFESLVLPLVIMAEIVADLSGALFALIIAGSGINIMSLIGIVVMCGIIINDSILKVDTINRLRKEYSLKRAIMLGGSRRLGSIVMTSLTTILAIAPFLVRGNMGADLQFPLSVALIGGMVLGTFVSLFFIPVLYYTIYE